MTTGTTTYTEDDLRQRLDSLPRIRLAALPTPLDDLPRLSAALGGPRILMKREDLTGLAMGGNKIREFEYSIAQALEAGCDVLLHGAAAQSNQSRQTAAVAAKLGLKAVQVGRSDAHAQPQGNLLLSHLFGAEIHLPEADDQSAVMEAKMAELRDQGYRPFNTSSDGYVYRGIAYVDGFLELWGQLRDRGIRPDAVYVCSGAHTHVGLVVAARALGLDLAFVGISPSARDDDETAHRLVELAAQQAEVLGLDLEVRPEDMETHSEFVGPGYGIVTDASREALQLLARSEAILLDPCYTGKAFRGMLREFERRPDEFGRSILFLHSGGVFANFAYADQFKRALESSRNIPA